VAEVPPLNRLAQELSGADVQLLYIYTRETHPGENVPPHRSYAEKLQRARQFRQEEGLQVPLLVDEFEGPVHRAYGGGPNMACVIHRDGRLVYRSEWTDVDDLRLCIQKLLGWDGWVAGRRRMRLSRIERIDPWFEGEATYQVRKRTYERAGQQAVQDYIKKTGRPPV
jgi:hypothetical protein